MTSPVPARVPLGATTGNRQWWVDVDNADSPDTPTWIPVAGIMEFQPGQTDNMEDSSDFDSGGFQSSDKTAEAWALTIKIRRGVGRTTPTAYDPGQEWIRTHSEGKMSVAAQVHVRWYEMTDGGPREQAYEGYASAGWSPDGGAMTALNTVTITLTGQGQRTAIDHPDAAGGGE